MKIEDTLVKRVRLLLLSARNLFLDLRLRLFPYHFGPDIRCKKCEKIIPRGHPGVDLTPLGNFCSDRCQMEDEQERSW